MITQSDTTESKNMFSSSRKIMLWNYLSDLRIHTREILEKDAITEHIFEVPS